MSDKSKKEFEFTLSENITVHKDGERQFCNKLLLKGPSSKQQRERCLIKQALMESINKANETASRLEQANAISGVAGAMMGKLDKAKTKRIAKDSINDDVLDIPNSEQLLSLLYMQISPDRLTEIFDAFNALLCGGCATAFDIALTQSIIDQIDADDMESLLGEYIENFIVPSWMKQAMMK